jgi:site-specific recombinase XerD
MPAQPPKLLQLVSQAIRTKHYSRRTEQTYTEWIKRYILFHGKRHPKDMGIQEIQAFRRSFAIHLLQTGGIYPERSRRDIRTVQVLLGHKNVKTTMIYKHVLQRGGLAVKSPLDG